VRDAQEFAALAPLSSSTIGAKFCPILLRKNGTAENFIAKNFIAKKRLATTSAELAVDRQRRSVAESASNEECPSVPRLALLNRPPAINNHVSLPSLVTLAGASR
jgi:hypothetical protein